MADSPFKGLLYSPEVLGGIGLLTAGLSGQNPGAALPMIQQGMKTASMFKTMEDEEEKRKLIKDYESQVPDDQKALFKAFPKEWLSKNVFAKSSKPTFETFISPDGKEVTINTSSKDGLAKATDLVNNKDYTKFTKSVSAKTKDDLTSKGTKGKIEKDLVNAYEARDLLENIDVLFEPEFVTYYGKSKAFLTREAQKLGITTSEDLEKFLTRQSGWKADVLKYTNKYRKFITGVAAGEKEIQLLANSIANPDDAPGVFKAKIKTQRIQNEMLIRRNEAFLSEGLGGMTRDADGNPTGKYKEYLENNPIEVNKEMAVEFVQSLVNDGFSNEGIELKIKQVFGRNNLDKVIAFLQ